MESNKMIAQIAWGIAGKYKYGHNIYSLCKEINKDYGVEELTLIDALYDGLEQLSEEKYIFWENNNGFDYREVARYGYCIINDIECFWYWVAGNDGEWTCDKPDFWDDMIEDWEAVNRVN